LDFIDTLLNSEMDWKDNAWLPDSRRQTTEERARALLMASYLFPFRSGRKDENPMITQVILPCISESTSVKVGSAAVASLIMSADKRDCIWRSISTLSPLGPEERSAEMTSLNQFMTFFEVGTSVLRNEAMRAAQKVVIADKDSQTKGMDFVALADLSNLCTSVGKASGSKGYLGRGLTAHMRKIRSLKATIEESKNDIAKKDATTGLAHEEGKIVRMFKGKPVEMKAVYSAKRAPGIRIVGSRSIVAVRFIDDKSTYILTAEDLKSLKFVAMSHSMWHLYSSTLDMEYDPLTQLNSPDTDDLTTALSHLALSVDEITRMGKSLPGNSIGQSIVPLPEARRALNNLWETYMRIMARSVALKKQDYLGRYLHELFETHTSALGGRLAAEGRRVQIQELMETYDHHGFSPLEDLAELEVHFSHMPLTCVQDFGRLSKIVFAYDVNPIYSYMHRVLAMRKPNPIGVANFTGEFDYTVRRHTQAEDDARKNRYMCGCVVMAVIADLKSSAMMSMDPQRLAALEAMPWSDAMTFFKANNIAMRSKCTYTPVANWPVPQNLRREARTQAKDLLEKGDMPEEPYAGAYIAFDNLFAYETRGEPDLNILKPTSVPDGDPLVVFSNLPGVERATPTRSSDGRRKRGRGNMITDFLLNEFPSRNQSLAFCATHVMLATTSDKIETCKYPLKTRIITGLCAAARRMQGEFESNNGKALVNTPGFQLGVDPADTRRSIYAAMRADLPPTMTRLFASLDLSSWSTGMHWDIQEWTNEFLRRVYDGGGDMFDILNKCTKGSLMVRSEKNVRLYSRNDKGADYEGVDGKRNTFMHCVLWYLARADAAKRGVLGVMNAFLYIDDGALAMEVSRDKLTETTNILRHSIFSTYLRYGFKLSILKTVFSEIYMQFLNEVYYHGIHVGYGFRALCHTASQTFPELATVSEELSVISSGIRGAAVSGGHPIRLMAGYHSVLHLYKMGVIGNKGKSLVAPDGHTLALGLSLPTLAGGFGLPNLTSLFSNLSGSGEVEKMDRCRRIIALHRKFMPNVHEQVREYVRTKLLGVSTISANRVIDRLTMAHPASVPIGAGDRSVRVAEAALEMCVNVQADTLLRSYLSGVSSAPGTTFAYSFVESLKAVDTRWPTVIVAKGLATDPAAAMALLIEKIASSNKVASLLSYREMRKMNNRYYGNALKLMRTLSSAIHLFV